MATKLNPFGFGVGGGGSGHGPFGTPLGQIPSADPFGDISRTGVNLAGINPIASRDLQAGFAGQLAPGTVNAIQDARAQWGASSGMPGFALGSLNFNAGARDIGTTSEALKDKAFQNYQSFVPTVAGTQTVSPAQQFEQNLQNQVSAHSPDPAQAQSYAESLYNKYLNSLKQTAKPKNTESHMEQMLWTGGKPSGQWNTIY